MKVNSIYHIVLSDDSSLPNGYYRLVWISKQSRNIYLFPMPDETSRNEVPNDHPSYHVNPALTLGRRNWNRKPKRVDKMKFLSMVENSYALEVQEIIGGARPKFSGNGIKSNIQFGRNQKILEQISNPLEMRNMLELNEYSIIAKNLAKTFSVSSLLVKRLISRFFQFGMDIEFAALSGNVTRKNVDRNQRVLTRKQGRKSNLTKTEHLQGQQEGTNSKLFEKEVMIFYNLLKDKSKPFTEQFKDFKKKFGVRSVISLADGTLVTNCLPESEFINVRQYRYIIEREIGKVEIAKNVAGVRNVSLKHRALLSDARYRISYAGHTYIIDATIADLYLVSAFDRSLLIGRPVIYIVIDAFSSLVLSVHITLEGPNFDQAMKALVLALSDKTAWLDYLGLGGLADKFYKGCRPTFVLADRGEMHSKNGRELAGALKFVLSIAAPYRADWKSLVERYFKTLNDEVIHWLPGAVRKRAKERGDRDVRMDAVLTLHEFTRLIAIEVAKWNSFHDMSRHISASMLKTVFEASPSGFWNYGLENLHGSPYYFGQTDVIERFMKPIIPTINRSGIFDGEKRYIADWMDNHPAIIGPSFRYKTAVSVYENPVVPMQIYCRIAGERHMRTANLSVTTSSESPIFPEDYADFVALQKLTGAEQKRNNEPSIDAFTTLQGEIVANAEIKAKEANKNIEKNKRERKSSIRENRQKDLDYARNSNVGQQGIHGNPEVPKVPSIHDEAISKKILQKISNWEDE